VFGRRNGYLLQELGRLDPAMPGDDATFGVDQHRVHPAELLQAVGDLPDLLLRMGARVVFYRA
jgi:hypothetical protein